MTGRAPRLRAIATLAGVTLLLAAYLAQSAIALTGEWWRLMYEPVRTDGSMESVARGVGRRRMHGVRLGSAIRSLGPLREVVAPTDMRTVSNVFDEYWKGRVTPALDPAIVSAFAAGTWRQTAYDPHLDAASLEEVKRGARVVRHEGAIYTIRTSDEDGRWVLATDELNRYLYVIPAERAGRVGLP